jgi:hypothetical protein
MSPDPWAFGLNHVLTLVGFAITTAIAYAGFKTFDKWKREKIEEKRIEIALEALALAYEAGFVFEGIRSPMSFEGEWAEMKGVDDPEMRRTAGPFFAILNRIDRNKDYFDRVWKMQPRFMAVFGKDAADVFRKMHQARTDVAVSARMLLQAAARGEPYNDRKFREKLENAIWNVDKDADEVGHKVSEFVAGIEKRCMPVVAHRYAKR